MTEAELPTTNPPGAAPAAHDGNETIDDRQILRERARALAREEESEDIAGERIDVIEFGLGAERYGIESSYVMEVCPLGELSRVPGAPSFVQGIVNLHGRIFSVINLRSLLGLPGSAASQQNRIIVLETEEMEFGILVDDVHGVKSIAPTDLQSSLPTLTDLAADLLRGVTEDRVVVLDGGRILSDPRIPVEAGAEAS